MRRTNNHIGLLFMVLSLFLLSCKETPKKEESITTTKVESIENKIEDGDNYANIKLQDGSTINLKPSSQSGHTNGPSQFTASLTDFEMVVMLQLTATDGPIEKKKYEGPEAGITVKIVGENSPIKEEYGSFFYINDNGEEGDAKIDFSSIGENNSEGTFSGTLYSKSGKKATIEGKFKT